MHSFYHIHHHIGHLQSHTLLLSCRSFCDPPVETQICVFYYFFVSSALCFLQKPVDSQSFSFSLSQRRRKKQSSYGIKVLLLCLCSSIALLFSCLPEKSQFCMPLAGGNKGRERNISFLLEVNLG